MTRYYSEYPEYSKISKEEYELRNKIIAVLEQFTREMEGYSYFGSNPGIAEDDYEDVAEAILLGFDVKERI